MAWRKRTAVLNELAEGLVKAGALQFGEFTLPDGRESSYYVNFRSLPSYPGTFKLVVEAMAELVKAKTPKSKALCGVPLMGLTLASPIALTLGKPLVYTRAESDPFERVIEGEVRPNWDFVLIQDMATSGKTLLSSAEAVRQEGGEVKAAVVLLDRMEGAREALSKQGVALHSVMDVIELSDILHSNELIDDEQFKSIARSVGRRPSRP